MRRSFGVSLSMTGGRSGGRSSGGSNDGVGVVVGQASVPAPEAAEGGGGRGGDEAEQAEGGPEAGPAVARGEGFVVFEAFLDMGVDGLEEGGVFFGEPVGALDLQTFGEGGVPQEAAQIGAPALDEVGGERVGLLVGEG